jgi:hypothetical protein
LAALLQPDPLCSLVVYSPNASGLLIAHLMYTEIKDVPSGYPTVAALISKDNDFAIFRKFRYLNARNLLYLQAELIDLENELETVDRSLEIKNETEELKSWKNFAKDEVRRDLALRIRKTLDEYSKKMWPREILYRCSSRR